MPAFKTVVRQVNGVFGLSLNLLLLYAIRRFSGNHFGAYKQLLTLFTLSDIFLTASIEFVRPQTLAVRCTHGVVTDTYLDDRRVTSLYAAFQFVPFTLLGIHFLYRYWSVRRPHLIKLFSNKFFVLCLVLVTVSACTSWYLLCIYGASGQEDTVGRRAIIGDYEIKYGKHIENAWIVFDHCVPNDNVLLATMVLMNVCMIFSLLLAASLAALTFYHINRTAKISSQATQIQKKLLIALCAQASVPSLFVYIPYMFSMNIPFFGIPLYGFIDMSVTLITCFPVWDAVVIILLISDYRKGLMDMVRKNQSPHGNAATEMTTMYSNGSYTDTQTASSNVA